MTEQKPKRHLRELPWVAGDPKRLVLTPLGRFVAQPVGNTGYGTGLHVYAHLDGEEESVSGLFSFGAKITPDGKVVWSQRQPNYRMKHDRADELLQACLKIAEDWFERDPGHCASYYGGLARRELYEMSREIRSEEHIIGVLQGLLEDPAAPKTRREKQPDGEWVTVPLTPEEREERRKTWRRNLLRAEKKIEALKAQRPRRIQLEEIRDLIDLFLEGAIDSPFPFPAE